MIIGFTCGTYDLLHAGHMLALKESREQCDKLIIGLQTDPTIDRPDSKNKPVQTVEERLIQLQGCKYVDEICIYSTEQELKDFLTRESNRINIRFLGADWEHKEFTGKGIIEKEIFTSRNHNFSSSNLRQRIAKDTIIK